MKAFMQGFREGFTTGFFNTWWTSIFYLCAILTLVTAGLSLYVMARIIILNWIEFVKLGCLVPGTIGLALMTFFIGHHVDAKRRSAKYNISRS